MSPLQHQSKRVRNRAPQVGRHRGEDGAERFANGFRALGELAFSGMKVSANITDLSTHLALVSIDDRVVLPTASVGKVLLLIEVAARITEREHVGFGILEKTQGDDIADSGIWRHMFAPALPLADLAALTAATSDNLATNVLLRTIGLDAVRARAESLGLGRTALLDLVRNERGPDDAPQLSVGSTAELAWLFGALARAQVVDATTSQRVLGWLSLNTDLSMVASAFGLDPLAHRELDHGIQLVNKTGTDAGVRAEAGVVRGPRAAVSYSVIVQFDDVDLGERLRVLEAMRTVGFDILEYLH